MTKSKLLEPKNIGGQTQASDNLLNITLKLLNDRSLIENKLEDTSTTDMINGFGYDLDSPFSEFVIRHLDNYKEYTEIQSFLEGLTPITSYRPKVVAPILSKLNLEIKELEERIKFDSTLFENEFIDIISFKENVESFIKELVLVLNSLQK